MDPVTQKLVEHAISRMLTLEDVELARTTEYDSTPIRVMKGCLCDDPNDLCADVIQAAQFDRGDHNGQSLVEFSLLLVVFVVAAFCFAALWGWLCQQPDFKKALNSLAVSAGATTVEQNEHSLKHIEATDIVNACNQDGPYQTWKDRFESHKYYFICKLWNGQAYGIIVVVVNGADVAMKTAFTPGDGTWNAVRSYLEMSASRFTGTIK